MKTFVAAADKAFFDAAVVAVVVDVVVVVNTNTRVYIGAKSEVF